jgi:hypothetical protein
MGYKKTMAEIMKAKWLEMLGGRIELSGAATEWS